MKTKFIVLLLLSFNFTFAYNPIEDWGQTGHRVVGEVASQYLNKKAKRAITRLLNGQTLAYVSTFADEIKSDKHYDYLSPYHYINMPLSENYNDENSNPQGDLYKGIQHAIEVLSDDSSSTADKEFQLKLLVHFIGDLHQPMHIGRAEDRGGNGIRLKWFGKNTNLHRVWDTDLIEYFNMSYTEWVVNISNKGWNSIEIKNIRNSNLDDWIKESHDLVETIYRATPENDSLGYYYTYVYKKMLEEQLVKGGIRLAKILNDIFG